MSWDYASVSCFINRFLLPKCWWGHLFLSFQDVDNSFENEHEISFFWNCIQIHLNKINQAILFLINILKCTWCYFPFRAWASLSLGPWSRFAIPPAIGWRWPTETRSSGACDLHTKRMIQRSDTKDCIFFQEYEAFLIALVIDFDCIWRDLPS